MEVLIEIARTLLRLSALPEGLRLRLPFDVHTDDGALDPSDPNLPAASKAPASLASHTVLSLSAAVSIIECLASTHSILLLGPVGIGKSDVVSEVVKKHLGEDAVHVLYAPQLAAEDLLGLPHLCPDGAVRWAPPDILIPRDGKPFGLFIDEIGAATDEVQRAILPLLRGRRVGEYSMPDGCWLIAAGNREGDGALSRNLSSAVVNRLLVLNVESSVTEWIAFAESTDVRREIIEYVRLRPESLRRDPSESAPFSTPRAWVSLSHAFSVLEKSGRLTPDTRRAVAMGMITASDAADFLAISAEGIPDAGLGDYLARPHLIPATGAVRSAILDRLRRAAVDGELPSQPPSRLRKFMAAIPLDERMTLLQNATAEWARIGGRKALVDALEASIP